MTWRDFFNADHSIYVNARHKLLHSERVAQGVIAHIPRADAVVLDFGCGEALGARAVAERCGKLYLYDSAPNVRARLVAAAVGQPKIRVLDDDALEALPDGCLDMIVVVSVLQYVSDAELARLLEIFRDKLKDYGLLVVADVVPKNLSAAEDARALLEFGFRGGFLFAAIAGLVRTALSDYRTVRAKFGLSTYDEAEMREILAEHDFTSVRVPQNIGHNQKRMTFRARKAPLD